MDQSGAVILARVSSKSQEDEGYSLDSQLKLLGGYCETKGLRIIKVFKITETASKEQSRKVFHEMMAYIAKEKIQHLAVEKTDRLTRNFRDAVAIDDWLAEDDNRRLHAVKEGLLLHKDARSDVKFMWNIHLAVAKKYTDNLREEAMKGWAEKLAQGWLPAPPPPGYVTVTEGGKRIHVPDPNTKTLVQSIFKKYLEPGQSIATVTEEMRLIGLRTRPGRPFAQSFVQKMLTNPFYIGINRFNGKEYPGAQEPIITKATFDKVQQKIHKGRPEIKKSHDPVLKNIILCDECNGVVTWQLQKGRYYGACQRAKSGCRRKKFLREDKVESTIVAMLGKLVCPSQDVIAWVASTMRTQHQAATDIREKEVTSIQSQITRLSRMEDGLYDDKLAEEITKEKYMEKHEQLKAQQAELRDKLNKAQKSFGVRLDERLVILELSQKAATIYANKTPEQKRLIITKLFSKLISNNDSLSVGFTSFAQAIADRSELSRNLLGV